MIIVLFTGLTFIGWIALGVYSDLSLVDLSVAAIIIFLTAFVCFLKWANRESDQKQDETNEEYAQRKQKELFDAQIGKTSELIDKVVLPLVQRHGLENTKDILVTLYDSEIWNSSCLIILNNTISPLCSKHGWKEVKKVLFLLRDRALLSSHNPELINTVFQLIESKGWDETVDILVSLTDVKILGNKLSNTLDNTIIPLLKSYEWQSVKNVLIPLRKQGTWRNQDILSLVERYGLRKLGDVLENIDNRSIWVGAHQDEVRAIMGRPYHIQERSKGDVWLYEPSKTKKSFKKRVEFRGVRVEKYSFK